MYLMHLRVSIHAYTCTNTMCSRKLFWVWVRTLHQLSTVVFHFFTSHSLDSETLFTTLGLHFSYKMCMMLYLECELLSCATAWLVRDNGHDVENWSFDSYLEGYSYILNRNNVTRRIRRLRISENNKGRESCGGKWSMACASVSHPGWICIWEYRNRLFIIDLTVVTAAFYFRKMSTKMLFAIESNKFIGDLSSENCA